MLAAVADPRVAAVCLIDPVDVTVYAPESPAYPSAVAALRSVRRERALPVALVGGGIGGRLRLRPAAPLCARPGPALASGRSRGRAAVGHRLLLLRLQGRLRRAGPAAVVSGRGVPLPQAATARLQTPTSSSSSAPAPQRPGRWAAAPAAPGVQPRPGGAWLLPAGRLLHAASASTGLHSRRNPRAVIL
jgi:hypothetical protein